MPAHGTPRLLSEICNLHCSIFDVLGRGKHSTVHKGRKKGTIIYYAIKSVEKSEKARVLQQVLICVSVLWLWL